MTTPYFSAIIFVITLGTSYYALSKNPALIERYLLYPYEMVRKNDFLPLLTHGFFHGSFLHMAVNMYVFFIISFNTEKLIGSTNFLLVYFGSLLVSGLISTLKKKDNPGYRSVGASGAISGLLFCFILLNPQLQLLVFFILPMEAWLFALLFLVGSYYAAKNGYFQRIDHEAHIWGALTGMGLTLLLIPGSYRPFLEMF